MSERFYLFASTQYYEPSGGMGDYVGAYDSLDEATEAARNGLPPYRWARHKGRRPFAWWQIATIREGDLVVVAEE